MKKPVESEKAIQNRIVKWLRKNKIFIYRQNTGKAWQGVIVSNKFGNLTLRFARLIHFGLKGSSDYIGCLPNGKILCIEFKRKGKNQEPDQIAFQKKIEENNGIYILARCEEDVINVIDEFITVYPS